MSQFLTKIKTIIQLFVINGAPKYRICIQLSSIWSLNQNQNSVSKFKFKDMSKALAWGPRPTQLVYLVVQKYSTFSRDVSVTAIDLFKFQFDWFISSIVHPQNDKNNKPIKTKALLELFLYSYYKLKGREEEKKKRSQRNRGIIP
jgi:hypothetical protein